MSIRNCNRCGKVIDENTFDLCSSCKEIEDIEFQKIKDYLNENPGATAFQVSTSLNISIKNIKRYLREGRLEIVDRELKSNSFLLCIKCGTNIRSGYYCMNCATSVQYPNSDGRPVNGRYSDANTDKSKNISSKNGVRYSQK